MAFKPPKLFIVGDNPALDWEKWRQSYEIFEEVAELRNKPIGQQRATLLHVIGPRGLELYNTFKFVSNSGQDITGNELTVKLILDDITNHFQPYKNTTSIRYKFFIEVQKEGQSIDEFVTSLKVLATNCQFGAVTEELIAFRSLCGVKAQGTRDLLLKEPDLHLDKAITICRAEEIPKNQGMVMPAEPTGSHSGVSVQAVKKKQAKVRAEKNSQKKSWNCKRCVQVHGFKECPAWGTTCKRCKGRNHFPNMCRAKRNISEIKQEDDDVDSDYIGAITEGIVASVKGQDWYEMCYINGKMLKFKMDGTGSQANIISQKIYMTLEDRPEIQKTQRSISSYTNHEISIVGIVKLKTGVRNQSHQLEYFVTKENRTPLLSLKPMELFKLITREVAEVTGKENTQSICEREYKIKAEEIVEEFQDVFKGLGKLQQTYKIRLRGDAVPTVSCARKIPQALKNQVKAELEKMVEGEVLKKTEEPTDWVHPIVIAKKPNGKIRLCKDPRTLNENIKRCRISIYTNSVGGRKHKNLY